MGIEVKIEAANAEELHRHIVMLANRFARNVTLPAEQPKEVEPEKPARASRKKADKEPEGNEPTGSTEPGTPSSGTPSEATESGAPAQENEPTVEYVDVQKAVTQLGAAKGRDAVVKVLNDLGVDHATKLKPEQWADAIAELQAAKEA